MTKRDILADFAVDLRDEWRWFPVKDTDPRVVALYKRHYSCRPNGKDFLRSGIGGPGETMALLTVRVDALYVWRLRVIETDQAYDDGQRGVMCAVFRNEGDYVASELIREAVSLARTRWPAHRRMFTYVWPAKVRSVNPGYCFKKAGWTQCGTTKGGLLIFEYVSEAA